MDKAIDLAADSDEDLFELNASELFSAHGDSGPEAEGDATVEEVHLDSIIPSVSECDVSVEEIHQDFEQSEPSSKRLKSDSSANACSEVITGANSLREAELTKQEAKRQEAHRDQEEKVCDFFFRLLVSSVDTNQIQAKIKELRRMKPEDSDFLETFLAELNKIQSRGSRSSSPPLDLTRGFENLKASFEFLYTHKTRLDNILSCHESEDEKNLSRFKKLQAALVPAFHQFNVQSRQTINAKSMMDLPYNSKFKEDFRHTEAAVKKMMPDGVNLKLENQTEDDLLDAVRVVGIVNWRLQPDYTRPDDLFHHLTVGANSKSNPFKTKVILEASAPKSKGGRVDASAPTALTFLSTSQSPSALSSSSSSSSSSSGQQPSQFSGKKVFTLSEVTDEIAQLKRQVADDIAKLKRRVTEIENGAVATTN